MKLRLRKPKNIYKIVICHHRPNYPETVTFLKVYHAETTDPEKLKELFRCAFNTANPTYMIEKITVKKDE